MQRVPRRIGMGVVAMTELTEDCDPDVARSAADLSRAMGCPGLAAMPMDYLTPRPKTARSRCNDWWQSAASWRPSIPHPLIAAAAELSQHTVLHLDKDFDLIAELTAKDVQRLRFE